MNTLKVISEADWKLEHNEITLGEYMDMVEPLSEVVPVKHGHWIDIDPESYTWKVRCSECSNERSMMSTQGKHPKYCEECGAKMDEVEE